LLLNLKSRITLGELVEEATIRKNRIVQKERNTEVGSEVLFFNLAAIICRGNGNAAFAESMMVTETGLNEYHDLAEAGKIHEMLWRYDMKDNVIDFMLKRAEINRKNQLEDYEVWEGEAELFNKQDWESLVEYRYLQAEKFPDDPYYQWGLGEGYVLNKEYERAICFLTSLHKAYPDHQDIQFSLLDALFAIGKDENSVDWIERPIVFRLNSVVLDFCYEFLKRKRKTTTVYDLHIELYSQGYPVFDDKQLMQFLDKDKRFLIQDTCAESYDCFISVVKKKI